MRYYICKVKASLTQKQKRVLSVINELIMSHGKSPTLKELKVALGLKATSSVQRHLDALKSKGYLVSEKYQSRSLVVHSEEAIYIPLVGNIAAGQPLLAHENVEAYIPYDPSNLRGNTSQYFFLRAVGDSMNNARVSGKTIDDGDFVLIKKQQMVGPGSRVVALIGDEATIKKFVPKDGHVSLQPESTNPKNKPILLFEDFSIQGIVLDVIKKGGR